MRRELNDYIIRLMEKRDIAVVADLEKQLFTDPWPEESFTNELNNKKISFPFVFTNETKIIGYVIARYYARKIHIGNIAIIPTYRRMGLAQRLLDHVFQKCNDYNVAFLEVRESNQSAVKLYQKIGFNKLGIHRSYYSDGEDALIMKKVKTM